jgi:hypothetical protein
MPGRVDVGPGIKIKMLANAAIAIAKHSDYIIFSEKFDIYDKIILAVRSLNERNPCVY